MCIGLDQPLIICSSPINGGGGGGGHGPRVLTPPSYASASGGEVFYIIKE